jgi:transmembrane sensor
MSNLVRFPSRSKTRQEASLWLVCVEEGLSEEERTKLAEWLASDRAHAEEFIRLARLWDDFDVLSELSDMFPLHQYRVRRVRWTARVAVAAGITACALASAWYFLADPVTPAIPTTRSVALPERRDLNNSLIPGQSDSSATSNRTYATAIGEQLSARLADGSVVTLNTATRLDIAYSASERLVTMEQGEASFNVAHDGARPFRVRAGQRVVQAVGTIFNVQIAGDDGIELTVSEGSVRVRFTDAQMPPRSNDVIQSAPDITVAAGQVAVFDSTAEAVRSIDAADMEVRLAWQHGMLIFRGAPLEAVLADVSRYTTVKFTVADESIRNRRVGGYFRTGDIDGLLVALRESFGIEPRRVGDEIVLTAQ